MIIANIHKQTKTLQTKRYSRQLVIKRRTSYDNTVHQNILTNVPLSVQLRLFMLALCVTVSSEVFTWQW